MALSPKHNNSNVQSKKDFQDSSLGTTIVGNLSMGTVASPSVSKHNNGLSTSPAQVVTDEGWG